MSVELGDGRATGRYTLTRVDVAARLGISTSSVRRLEGVKLHPIQDGRGVWRFDPDELHASPAGGARRRARKRRAKDPGTTAAQVFRMLARGLDLREIVVTARQPPERVRQLYREWMTDLERGERDQQARQRYVRRRREQVDDERAHLEWMKAILPGP